MYDIVYDGYSNYEFWLEQSHKYSIIHVLEFCGSEKYVIEASMALSMFSDTVPDYSNFNDLEGFFIQNFKNLPFGYKDAITRNGHLSQTFFMKIIDDIDWNIFVENVGMPLDLFEMYFHLFNIYVCANSNIRKDIFDLFDRAEVLRRLNIVQKLRSPRFDDRTELDPLGPLCKTDEEKAYYVEHIVLKNRKSTIPVWVAGESSQFWYTYFLYNAKLCSIFCDNTSFLEANVAKFNWNFICINPSMDIGFLRRRIRDLNRANLLQANTNENLIELFDSSYDSNDLYKWYMSIKFPAEVSDFIRNYYGNRAIIHTAPSLIESYYFTSVDSSTPVDPPTLVDPVEPPAEPPTLVDPVDPVDPPAEPPTSVDAPAPVEAEDDF